MIAFPKLDDPEVETAIQSVVLQFLPTGIVRMSVMGDSGELEIYEGRPRPGAELAVTAVGNEGLVVGRNRKMNVQMREE